MYDIAVSLTLNHDHLKILKQILTLRKLKPQKCSR